VSDNDSATAPTNSVPSRPPPRDRIFLVVMSGTTLGEMHEIGDEMVLGRGGRHRLGIRDDGVSRDHARIRRHASALLLEDLGSRNGTYVNGERVVTPVLLRDGDRIHLGAHTILRVALQDTLDESVHRHLYEASNFDALTRAVSRRHFLERLDDEIRFARRHQTPLALLLLDLDRLKEINDGHGHGTGDRALVEVARAVQDHMRGEDLFGRLGGDEFAALCRATSLPAAAAFAERLRALITAIRLPVDDGFVALSVSIGVVAIPGCACRDAGDLVDAADRALYRAKTAGRNQVVVASGQPAS